MNELKRIFSLKNPLVLPALFVVAVIVFDIIFLSVKTKNINAKADASVEQWKQYYESIAASAPAPSTDGTAITTPQLQVSEEAKYLARVVAGCATYNSANVQKAVAWCVLNRVDSALYPDNIIDVCEQANQWQGYENASVIDSIAVLCQEVIDAWQQGGSRDIPKDCLYFRMTTDGIELRTEYATGGNTWVIKNE